MCVVVCLRSSYLAVYVASFPGLCPAFCLLQMSNRSQADEATVNLSKLMLPLSAVVETQVEILESVRGKDVFIIQTGCG